MNISDQRISDEAALWAVRTRDSDFADWDGFIAWLEADPAHNIAYERALLAAEDAAALLATVAAPAAAPVSLPEPANDEPARIGRRRLLGGMVAASLLAVTTYAVLQPGGGALETVRTEPGQRRTIELADGSRIAINGGTTLVTDRDRPRFARLDSGEAAFFVVHNTRDPFVVEAGGATLQDAGTAFNVRRGGGRTEVAVSEGLVIYNPAAEAVRLPPGRQLRVTDGRAPVVGEVAVDSVAGWRSGRLFYDGASLADVAADLQRNTGMRVSAAPAVAGRPFTGVITLEGGNDRLFARLGPLLGVDVQRNDQGWTLTNKP
ncbi:FecR family protein [Sphingomonas sanxanigenens]|nr:FecR domain-containing protein [Sphingomonas sanxanigenens]